MSGPDVRQLAQESVPNGSFPVTRQSDYRVYFAPEVHAGIHAHASAKTDVEICGVLVGVWERDADGPFARISEYIRCNSATQKFAEVTFTHESWSQINKEMDTRFSDLRIIGWYHSHPDFGIFLSDRDGFIQQNFFSGPGQVAFVVDPVRHLEGLFEWRDGKTELISHYWIGNQIVSSNESQQSRVDRAATTASSMAGPAAASSSTRTGEFSSSIATTVLAWLCMFLLGYLLHGARSRWDEQMLREGTVAHYGVFNLQMLGWEDQMRETQQKLEAVSIEVKSLADDHASAAGDKGNAVRKQWRSVREQLAESTAALEKARSRYGLGAVERATLERMVSEKIAEVSGVRSRERNTKPNTTSNTPAADAKPGAGAKGGKAAPGETVPGGKTVSDAAKPDAATPNAATPNAATPNAAKPGSAKPNEKTQQPGKS